MVAVCVGALLSWDKAGRNGVLEGGFDRTAPDDPPGASGVTGEAIALTAAIAVASPPTLGRQSQEAGPLSVEIGLAMYGCRPTTGDRLTDPLAFKKIGRLPQALKARHSRGSPNRRGVRFGPEGSRKASIKSTASGNRSGRPRSQPWGRTSGRGYKPTPAPNQRTTLRDPPTRCESRRGTGVPACPWIRGQGERRLRIGEASSE
jgi:hypothetical protein